MPRTITRGKPARLFVACSVFPYIALGSYCASSIELGQLHNVTPERLLGIPIDLVDVDQYLIPASGAVAAPEDAPLYGEKTGATQKKKRVDSAPTAWLRKQRILDNNL
jgi:hypothetical protein